MSLAGVPRTGQVVSGMQKRAVVDVPNPIYKVGFASFSHGFRPGCNSHDAPGSSFFEGRPMNPPGRPDTSDQIGCRRMWAWGRDRGPVATQMSPRGMRLLCIEFRAG